VDDALVDVVHSGTTRLSLRRRRMQGLRCSPYSEKCCTFFTVSRGSTTTGFELFLVVVHFTPTSVVYALGPGVNSSSTDFSFQNLVFWEFI
jgi:hypothetical protein